MSLRIPRSERPKRGSFTERTDRTANLTRSHRRAPKQEKEVAARLGGKRTPASGAREVKGDVRIKGIARIECKTTKHKSFSVSLDMLQKLEENAAAHGGEVVAIIVEFCDPDSGRKLGEVAVCPTYVLDGLRA